MAGKETILIAGGGTGGHVFPGVAIAEELRALREGLEVVFVGTERGMEARVIPGLGYTLETLEVRYLQGSGVGGWARGLGLLPGAGLGALRVLREHKPRAVLSVGGYAAGPVTMVAAARGYRTALMEQNARAGLTNRLLGRAVDRCFVSFGGTLGLPAEKCVEVGNPVRRGFLEAARSRRGAEPGRRAGEGGFRVLVTGGSGGAGTMNAELPGLFRRLPEEVGRQLVVRHQAGRGRDVPVREGYAGFVGQVEVVEFIEDMVEGLRWADLVVCRAGATTLAELMVLGKAALYVPFPGAADQHQERNARRVVESGAGVMLLDHELASERAERLLVGLIQNPEGLGRMGERALELARPEAGRVIAEALLALSEGGR